MRKFPKPRLPAELAEISGLRTDILRSGDLSHPALKEGAFLFYGSKMGDVGVDEVLALKQQRCIHGLGERVSCAFAEIQPRFRIDAFAKPLKRQDGHFRQPAVMRNHLRGDKREEVL